MLNSNFNTRSVKSRSLAGKVIILFIQRSFSVVGLFAILFAAGLNNSRAQDTWTHKASFGGTSRYGAVGFSIGTKGYIGTGYDNSYKNDFWEYDPVTNAWTQKANFGGTARRYAVGFSIGSKGYIGTGADGSSYKKDFWEYDPSSNTWIQKADFGGIPRQQAVGFCIGSKGYIGTGGDYSNKKDFWEYDPSTDTWIQKADFGGIKRFSAVGFSIGSKGYIGTGYAFDFKKDFWEYDPTINAWTQKADFGGTTRYGAVGFSIGSKGYIGTGDDGNYKNDFWEYDPATNTWTQKAHFGGMGGMVRYASGFSIGNKGYLGTGYAGYYTSDFREYTPSTSGCAAPTNLSVTDITSSSATLHWDAMVGASSYKIRYRVAGTSQWTTKNSNGNSITLTNLSADTKYTWQVKTNCPNDPGSDWSAKKNFTTAPLRLSDVPALQTSFQIYPNPAEDYTTIQFTLAQSSHASLKVYDVSGKEIIMLLNEDVQQGDHSLQINTNHFSKGVYIVKVISDFGIENQKLIVQ